MQSVSKHADCFNSKGTQLQILLHGRLSGKVHSSLKYGSQEHECKLHATEQVTIRVIINSAREFSLRITKLFFINSVVT